jgi:Zn-dependent protease
MQIDLIFGIAVLALSVILHEVAHGYMANWLGDPTARLQGRLTLNPLSHIDLVGSLLLPAILVVTHSPMLIGYAKPVPYNPYNLRGKYAEGLVAFAGPGVNIVLALIFGLAIRAFGMQLGTAALTAFGTIAYVNMLLALFNLIPIPPLDGSKVLSSIFLMLSRRLAEGYDKFRLNFESMGQLPMILAVLLVFYFISPVFSVALLHLFGLLTGVSA